MSFSPIEIPEQMVFGDSIKEVVLDMLKQFDVQNAKVFVTDRGALECVIRARVETAIIRGKGE